LLDYQVHFPLKNILSENDLYNSNAITLAKITANSPFFIEGEKIYQSTPINPVQRILKKNYSKAIQKNHENSVVNSEKLTINYKFWQH